MIETLKTTKGEVRFGPDRPVDAQAGSDDHGAHDDGSSHAGHNEGWALEDHACIKCLGRILYRNINNHRREYRCADCGNTGEADVDSVCACGAKIGGNAGIECLVNDRPTPDFSAQIVAGELH
jgi:hypothetical protein